MKKNRLVLLVLTFLLAPSLPSAGKTDRLDGIVATIGDEVVLQSEIDAYTALRLNALNIKPDSGGADLQKYRRQFLEEIVDGKVLIAHAKIDTTLSVSAAEVDRALENHIASILAQNRLTIDSLEILLKKEQGTTLAKFKAETRGAIRDQLIKQKVQRQYLSSVKVSRRDVEVFFQQYRDSLPKAGESVLLSRLAVAIEVPASVRQAAWEKILSIKQRLAGGADFGDCAKRFSEGPEAAEGGDLGFIEKGSLNLLAFEERAFSLPLGGVSDPFETPLGFHIVNVLARQEQKVHVRQIFIKVEPPAALVGGTTALLDSIRRSIHSSSDFSAAVGKYSSDNTTRTRGGLVGWKLLFDLNGPLRAAIDSLSSDSVTPVLREGKELVIYRVNGRVKERSLSLDSDWQVLADKAQDIMAQKKLRELVGRWRRLTHIDIRM